MKKLLLLVVVSLVSLTTLNAQILSNQSWQKTLESADATTAYDAPVVVSEKGDVYVAGATTQEFAADASLTIPAPFATGSYVAKYNASGAAQWGILIDGESKITSMAVDSKDVLYVAGSYYGTVWFFNSNFSDYTEIDGEGSFIAKYKADGTLEFLRTIAAVTDPEIEASGMYGWSGETPSFNTYKIQVEGSKLYVGANYCGDVTIKDYTSKGAENPSGDLTLQGKYALVWGFMYTDMQSSAVFSFNTSKMNGPTLVADMAPAAEIIETDAIFKVQTANFVVDGGSIYVAAMGYGNLAAKTANGTQNVSFSMDGAGTNEYGMIVVKTGAADVVKVYNSEPTTLSTDYYNLVGAMEVTNGTLYISGVYRGYNPFDSSMSTDGVSTSDIYVASLKTSNLEKNWVVTTPDQNDTENAKYEDICGTIIYPAGIQIAGAVKDVNTHAVESNYNYSIDFNGNATALSQTAVGALGYNVFQAAYASTVDGITTVCAGELETAASYEGVAGDNVKYKYTPANATIAFTGTGAMYEYESADEVAIPWAPFKNDITTATIQNGITNVPGYAFSKCAALENVTLPNSITVISRNSFASCAALTELTIPNKVEEIGLNAFNACGFVNIVLPNSVKTMGNTVFSGCDKLETVTLSKSMTALPTSTFNKCTALKEVYVPEGVKTLMFGAFHSCSSLAKVTLAASVDSIGDYAFYNNTKLSKVYSMNTVAPKAPGSKVFSGVPATTAIFVPVGSVTSYQVADGWKNFFIEESSFTGVESAEIVTENIAVKGGNIVVEGYVGKVQVVSISGQVVKDIMVNDFAEISMPQGLYIVVTSKGAQKVIVK